MEELLFGPAGIPWSSRAPTAQAGIERVRELGLDCMEVQFVQGVRFQKGRAYSFRIWMRGQPGRRASLLLRKAGSPYTTFASRDISLAAEWQQCRVEGVVAEDTTGMLMVIVTEPQTLYLDDAVFEDLAEAMSNVPPKKGNLLGGGSFEAGVSFGWSVRIEGDPGVVFQDSRPRADSSDARFGARSLRIDVPRGGFCQIQSPVLELTGNREHCASVWMKSSRPDTGLHKG